jgi:hypothetical protein
MTDRTHLTLRVELDPHDGSIAGRVLDGGAIYRSFSAGWAWRRRSRTRCKVARAGDGGARG